MTTNVNITNLDPSGIKQSLIDFISSKPEFSDYNLTGSGFNVIIDLLTRNSTYMAYLANMNANESFLDSAKLDSSIISHARMLGYLPASRRAAKANVKLVVTPADPTGIPNQITLSKGKSFLTNDEQSTYFYTNRYSHVLFRVDDHYESEEFQIYQGQLSATEFVHDGTNEYPTFILPNKNIDTSTLSVVVQVSEANSSSKEYKLGVEFKDILNNESVYYLSKNRDGYYVLEFGDNTFGSKLQAGNVIQVEYITADPDYSNGQFDFSLPTSVSGYSNTLVEVSDVSYGGTDPESKDSIRHNAPLYYSTQNRAVLPNDYVVITRNLFPSLRAVYAWSGLENIPPEYGKVMVSIVPEEGVYVTEDFKKSIKKKLQEYSIITIEPVIVEPEYISLDVNVFIRYDDFGDSLVNKRNSIISIVSEFSDNNLKDFSSDFNSSRVTKLIHDSDQSIESCYITYNMKKEIDAVVGQFNYVIDFKNVVNPNSVVANVNGVIEGETFNRITDDGIGNLICNGITTGSVDYKTGVMTLKANIFDDKFKIGCGSDSDIESNNNNIVLVDTIAVDKY